VKKHRVFIAINLPTGLKRRLASLREKWPGLPVRWIKEANLHLTLIFIGYVNDDEVAEICRIAGKAAKKYPPFELKFNRVVYGPLSAKTMEGQPDSRTRMIWLEGEKSEVLARLKDDLENSLLESRRSGFYRKEDRQFRPHLTLARMKDEWRDYAPKPEINLEFKETVPVETIDVMESELRSGGAEYAVLESAQLKTE
jgi:2'-5' RNA ligase